MDLLRNVRNSQARPQTVREGDRRNKHELQVFRQQNRFIVEAKVH